MEVLQGVVDDAKSLDAAKEQALADITAIAATIEKESNIETLIKAKGFEECVAVINGDKANIIVKSEGSSPISFRRYSKSYINRQIFFPQM